MAADDRWITARPPARPPAFPSFAVKPGDQVLSQIVIVPVFGTIVSLIGIGQ